MPVLIEPATTLYTRLLNNLNIAATHNVHRNWLAFVSHLMRTSYIQAPIRRAVHKGVKVDIDTLTRLTTESMFFQKRREIYKKLNTNAFTKGLGADYQNIMAQVRKSVDSPPGMLTEDHHHTVHEERHEDSLRTG